MRSGSGAAAQVRPCMRHLSSISLPSSQLSACTLRPPSSLVPRCAASESADSQRPRSQSTHDTLSVLRRLGHLKRWPPILAPHQTSKASGTTPRARERTSSSVVPHVLGSPLASALRRRRRRKGPAFLATVSTAVRSQQPNTRLFHVSTGMRDDEKGKGRTSTSRPACAPLHQTRRQRQCEQDQNGRHTSVRCSRATSNS